MDFQLYLTDFHVRIQKSLDNLAHAHSEYVSFAKKLSECFENNTKQRGYAEVLIRSSDGWVDGARVFVEAWRRLGLQTGNVIWIGADVSLDEDRIIGSDQACYMPLNSRAPVKRDETQFSEEICYFLEEGIKDVLWKMQGRVITMVSESRRLWMLKDRIQEVLCERYGTDFVVDNASPGIGLRLRYYCCYQSTIKKLFGIVSFSKQSKNLRKVLATLFEEHDVPSSLARNIKDYLEDDIRISPIPRQLTKMTQEFVSRNTSQNRRPPGKEE